MKKQEEGHLDLFIGNYFLHVDALRVDRESALEISGSASS